MKVALCLYGYFNNREDINAGDKGHKYIVENIFNKCENVDVFIHSWDLENKNKILKLYHPLDYTFESQIDFNNPQIENEINFNFDRSKFFSACKLQASLSFFYSRGQAILLANKKEYDIVIVSRFDLGVRSKMHLGYNVSLMKFDPFLDMNFIYSAKWAQLNAGYADQWFFSNSKNINILSKMYDQAVLDLRVGSEYHKNLDNWFDSFCKCSNGHNHIKGNKECEISNEILKNEKDRSKNLMRYPTWQIINNHIYHKWFFKQNGLYEISKWI